MIYTADLKIKYCRLLVPWGDFLRTIVLSFWTEKQNVDAFSVQMVGDIPP